MFFNAVLMHNFYTKKIVIYKQNYVIIFEKKKRSNNLVSNYVIKVYSQKIINLQRKKIMTKQECKNINIKINLKK